MSKHDLTRRGFFASAAALGLSAALPGAARAAQTEIHVMKDPNCGCCSAWIDILQNEGFAVTTERSFGTALTRYKMENGIPVMPHRAH